MDQLKDVILSTLEEIQQNIPLESANNELKEKKIQSTQVSQKQTQKKFAPQEEQYIQKKNFDESELFFLNSLRERMLVLFEGFQAPNNVALEAKIDLTLNFLEYVLSTIDSRIEQIKGK